MKDDYRIYMESDHDKFRTMVEQEALLLNPNLADEDVDVCPSCFQIYHYLDHAYYQPILSEQVLVVAHPESNYEP